MLNVKFLQIEPTTRCNFKCGFCCGRRMAQKDLSFEIFAGLVESLPQVFHVELQGEGEPFMHAEIFKMVRFARAREIRISLITNGSLLSSRTIDEIVNTEIDKLLVSIESANPDVFRQIRGGSLSKVVAGIKRLNQTKKAHNRSKPSIGFATILLRQTKDDFAGIVDLYRGLELSGGIAVQMLQTMDFYTQFYDDKTNREQLSAAEQIESLMALRADFGLELAGDDKTTGFYGELFTGWRPGEGRCPWLDGGMFVNARGQPSACCLMKKPQLVTPFGERNNDSLLRQFSLMRDSMRASLAAGVIPAACDGCGIARAALKPNRRQAPIPPRLPRRLSIIQG